MDAVVEHDTVFVVEHLGQEPELDRLAGTALFDGPFSAVAEV